MRTYQLLSSPSLEMKRRMMNESNEGNGKKILVLNSTILNFVLLKGKVEDPLGLVDNS
jgi:hypothetical protein